MISSEVLCLAGSVTFTIVMFPTIGMNTCYGATYDGSRSLIPSLKWYVHAKTLTTIQFYNATLTKTTNPCGCLSSVRGIPGCGSHTLILPKTSAKSS